MTSRWNSKLRMAWLLVMFDIPVMTTRERAIANGFRINLKKDGYIKIQHSIYARPSGSIEKVTTHVRRLKNFLPEEGEVRLMQITDTQWTKIKVFRRSKAADMEKRPEQLLFF